MRQLNKGQTIGYAANSGLPKVAVMCFVGQFCGRFKCSSSIELLC
jgi:hypothetical protein